MGKKIGIVLIVLLAGIQFFRPGRNNSGDTQYAVNTLYTVPDDVQQILKVACNDCHSNKTNYPWYAGIQPVGWWLNHHIEDGKGDLNFSEFTEMPLARQFHKFEEIIEMVDEEEMPLPSYTYFGLHSEAKLDDLQKQRVMDWAQAQLDMLRASYPADSLVRPGQRPIPASD